MSDPPMSDVLSEAWTHTGYAQRLHFGAGVVVHLPEITKELGIRRALLVTTARRAESEEGERIVKLLGRSLVSTFADARSLDDPIGIAAERCESVVRDDVVGHVAARADDLHTGQPPER